MRVVFATYPLASHLIGMVPLAWALRSAGHQVCVACHPELLAAVGQAGLPGVAVGGAFAGWEVMARKQGPGGARRENFTFTEESLAGDPTWDQAVAQQQGQVKLGDLIHGQAIEELTELCRRWRPDLVIWDPMFPAASIAAEAAGAAHGRLLAGQDFYGFLRSRFVRLKRTAPAYRREDPLADWIRGWSSRYGVEFSESLVQGRFTIDRLPAWAALGHPADPLRLRSVPYDGAAVVPGWVGRRPRRPRVCLTLGITAAKHPVFPSISFDDLQGILDALAELPIELVAAVRHPGRHGLRVPRNTCLVERVPLHALLPTCSAVVHPGGLNTFNGALYHGVPQLLLADVGFFDSPVRAERLRGKGAGLIAAAAPTLGEACRDGLLRILRDPAITESAVRLGREVRSLPSPADLAARLPALADRHRAPVEGRSLAV